MDVICSTSECVETLYKAAVGAGFPVASAKQSAVAAVWMQRNQTLITHGLDGFHLMLTAVERGPCDLREHIQPDPEGQKVNVDGGSIVDIGPCVLDAVMSDSMKRSVILNHVAGGGLLLGMIAGPIAPPLAGFDLVLAAVPPQSSDQINLTVDEGADRKAVRLGQKTWTVAELQRAAGPVEVDDELWRRACTFAAATYVPSSDESRQGAGAGLTDND